MVYVLVDPYGPPVKPPIEPDSDGPPVKCSIEPDQDNTSVTPPRESEPDVIASTVVAVEHAPAE